MKKPVATAATLSSPCKAQMIMSNGRSKRNTFAAWRAAGRDRLAALGGRSLASLGRGGALALRKAWLGGGLFPALVIGAFALRWIALWRGALTYDAAGLWAGQAYIWGDWALHLGDVTSFVYGDNFPPTNTRYAGAPLAYHYLTSITAAASRP